MFERLTFCPCFTRQIKQILLKIVEVRALNASGNPFKAEINHIAVQTHRFKQL
ncbi:Uncharacterised protein [Vibrio cholerae]|uniref:Uncharacterized protein n=1 Tax=Vibrio cholerae TaxID=666 RepID=A0A655UMU1_VIBCL|nr:Uncharacterised protein [Vibrio cholerae]CSA98731.1 Uncharacterised protein [Vibrio cholerae]CSB39401.1 Uncharacterised protein [Vibrio cholerae]CSB48442.1 Uncharacterised protein [Vibrio cholerae]CSB53123.1 Uncharacterised protein [Vibrio cholerae]